MAEQTESKKIFYLGKLLPVYEAISDTKSLRGSPIILTMSEWSVVSPVR